MATRLVLKNVDNDTSYYLREGILELGRGKEVDIVINDRSLSRVHARIYNVLEGFWVEDLGSSNGTYIRGSALEEATNLQLGERVQFGNAVFTLEEVKEPEVATTEKLSPLPEGTEPVSPSLTSMRRKTEKVPVEELLPKVEVPSNSVELGESKPLPAKYGLSDSGRIVPAPKPGAKPKIDFMAQVESKPSFLGTDENKFPWKVLFGAGVVAALSLGIILGFIIGKIV
ncbi:MAG: FHA domain-containing protein [Verrucomicrobiota bacterium]